MNKEAILEMLNSTNNGAVSYEFGKPVVAKVHSDENRKTVSYEVRQPVTLKIELNDERGEWIDESKTITRESERVHFMRAVKDAEGNVPSIDEVQEKVNKMYEQGANIHYAYSYIPDLQGVTRSDLVGNPGLLDQISTAQAVRYPASHELKGMVALDSNNLPFYRITTFSAKITADKDNRDTSKTYFSPEVEQQAKQTAALLAAQDTIDE